MAEFVACIKSENCLIYRDFFDISDKITTTNKKFSGIRAFGQLIFKHCVNNESYELVVFQYGLVTLGFNRHIEKYNNGKEFMKYISNYHNNTSHHFQLVKYDINGKPIDIYYDDPILHIFKEFYSNSCQW